MILQAVAFIWINIEFQKEIYLDEVLFLDC